MTTMSDQNRTAIPLILMGGLAMIFLGVIWRSYAIWLLWDWFVVPLGVRPIGMAWALGLSVFTHLIMPRTQEPADETFQTKLVMMLCGPLFAIALGWVAHSYM